MKWALLGLACVSLLMCCTIVYSADDVDAGSGVTEHLMTVEAAAASTYSAGAIAAGLIGAASALGAALIQISENKRKNLAM